MADSVGKIQLDLEITPNSIAQQISAVSRAFASGMQRSFSQMKNFTRGTFSDMARQMRSVVSRETPVPDDTTMKIESLVEQMENAFKEQTDGNTKNILERRKAAFLPRLKLWASCGDYRE